jgi:hypothetical protein
MLREEAEMAAEIARLALDVACDLARELGVKLLHLSGVPVLVVPPSE